MSQALSSLATHFDPRGPLLISPRAISPIGLDALPLGRTPETRILRSDSDFTAAGPLFDLQVEFLRIVAEMAPPEYRHGNTFARVLNPAPTAANETHRDKDSRALNFVCFVAAGPSVQHEFIAEGDFWETYPTVIPNGHVIRFTKHLHRRPERPAGTGRKVFLSASLYGGPAPQVTGVEPYECHGGVL